MLSSESNCGRFSLVERILQQHPSVTLDEVVEELAAFGHDVTVSPELRRRLQLRGRAPQLTAGTAVVVVLALIVSGPALAIARVLSVDLDGLTPIES